MQRIRLQGLAFGVALVVGLGGCVAQVASEEEELEIAAQIDRDFEGHALQEGTLSDDELEDIPVEPGLYVADGLGAEEDPVDPDVEKRLFSSAPLSWVSNTSQLPARRATQLIVTHANGVKRRCSGTVVGTDAVLTNAHCVYNASRGGWAYSIEVVPARNGSSYPYVRTWGRKLYCPYSYRQYDQQNDDRKVIHDYAILRTHANVGSYVGTQSIVARSRQVGRAVALYGYPQDSYPNHMYTSSDSIRKTYSNGIVYHRASTLSGMSGAALLEGNTVYGVHAGEEPNGNYNDGIQFTSSVVSTLNSWATN